MTRCSASLRLLIALLLALISTAASSSSSSVYTLFPDSACATDAQQVAFAVSSDACTASTSCAKAAVGSTTLYLEEGCATSHVTATKAAFGDLAFVLMEVYDPSSSVNCSSLLYGVAFLANGSCLVTDNGNSSVKASISSSGTAVITTYDGTKCSGTAVKQNTIASSDISAQTCISNMFKFHTSSSTSTTTSSSSSSATTTTATTTSSTTTTTKSSTAATSCSRLSTLVLTASFVLLGSLL